MRCYSELIFVESNDCMEAGGRATHGAVAETLKQTHSKLCNCFSNAAIGTKSAARNPQPWPCEVQLG